MITLANRKYDGEFNDRLFLEQLLFMDDLAGAAVQFLGPPTTKDEIGDFFSAEVQRLQL